VISPDARADTKIERANQRFDGKRQNILLFKSTTEVNKVFLWYITENKTFAD
jgi:hypothetical protein